MSKNTIIIADAIELPLSRERVWQKLNDPQVLAECIGGCTAVEKQGNQFKAVITAHIFDYKKDFKVDLKIADADAPENYQLSSELSAGLFGKADAVAAVSLICIGELSCDTRLEYTATVSASGVIAKALPLVRDLAERRVRAFFELFQQTAIR